MKGFIHRDLEVNSSCSELFFLMGRILEDIRFRQELVQGQVVDHPGDLLVLHRPAEGAGPDDQPGVAPGIVDDTRRFPLRPAPLLEDRVLVAFLGIPALVVNDLGRPQRRRDDFQLLERTSRCIFRCDRWDWLETDGHTQRFLALEGRVELVDEAGDKEAALDGVGLGPFANASWDIGDIIILDVRLLLWPENGHKRCNRVWGLKPPPVFQV